MVMAISILIRSAGINGNTHTASAADTVYPPAYRTRQFEGVADGGSHDHAKKLDPAFLAVVNHDAGNDCHWDKACNITAGGAGQFGNSAGKAGEDRKACEADQQIEK